jgi:hypothetical protein
MTYAARIARLLLTLGVAMLALRAAYVGYSAAGALDFVLSLDYGEGIVLQQALLILTSLAYGDVNAFPFLVFHYPPGFLLAARAGVALGLDVVFAGRLVSFASTIAAALAVGALVRHALRDADAGARWVGAAGGAVSVFAFVPVAAWMPLARVDMLAFALTLWGLVLALHMRDVRWQVPAAAALFTAAVFTRQTALAAPVAATIVLAMASPRDALRLVVTGLALSVATLVLMSWVTDGRFLTHIVGYNVNRYELWRLVWIYDFALLHGPLVLLGGLGTLVVVASLWQRRLQLRASLGQSLELRARLGAFIYVGLSTLLLALIAKSGSATNYFIEWVLGCAVMIGVLVGGLARAATAGASRSRLALAGAAGVVLLVALQLRMLPAPPHVHRPYPQSSPDFANALIELARSSDRSFISDDMVLHIRSGKVVPWEPAIFAELASLGRWDEAQIIDQIRRGRFAFALTVGERGDEGFDARYNAPVADALDAAFPRLVRRGRIVIRLPNDSQWLPP